MGGQAADKDTQTTDAPKHFKQHEDVAHHNNLSGQITVHRALSGEEQIFIVGKQSRKEEEEQHSEEMSSDEVMSIAGAEKISNHFREVESQDGKIQEVRTGYEIPWTVDVVDYSKKIIVPGMVEAHVARGYDVANETNALTPFVTVLDNIDTSHDTFTSAVKGGVTALHIMPGNNTILGGKGALVKSVGLVVEDMLLIPESGMKISVVGTPAQTRMGVLAQLVHDICLI